MKKLILQKNYAGEFPRPTVQCIYSEKIFIAGTPWGTDQALTELTKIVTEFLSASFTDQDVTSPFARLPQLSSTENNLRNAAFLANDTLYQKLNKELITSSCEVVILFYNGNEVSWIQVGQPHVMLLREGKIHPLQVAADLGLEYKMPTPLPSRLIGLDRHWDVEVRTFKLSPNDGILLLARSSLPLHFFSKKFKTENQEKLVQDLFEDTVEENDKLPFWISLLN